MTDGIDRYVTYLTQMNGSNVADLKKFCTEDVHFRDPFNNVKSVDAFIAIMEETFETLADVRFEVLDVFRSDDRAVIKWHFHFRLKKNRHSEYITGLSEVTQNAEQQITAHLDYWDSGERIYGKIPVVGGLIRFIRGKLSAGLDQVHPA
jgi:steroid delta-isomerase